jgi:hypothetical protein
MTIERRRHDLKLIAIGLTIAIIPIGIDPSHAINLNRSSGVTNDFITQQLELLKSKNQTAFDRLQEIDNLVKALGLSERKNSTNSLENRSSTEYSAKSFYEYQYQLSPSFDRETIETSQVLANIGQTLSQLDLTRRSSGAYQVQILGQSSLEGVDEGIYYYQRSSNQTAANRQSVINTILSAPKTQPIAATIPQVSQIQAPKVNNIVGELLGDSLGSSLSFFSGVKTLKENSATTALQSKSVIPLGSINTIPVNTNYTKVNIERSKYQMAIDEQNAKLLEQQEDRREDLEKSLKKAQQQREKEQEKEEEERRDRLEDARENRQDRLEDLQKKRRKQAEIFTGR